ncbi:trypsin inhibitor-like cysteine-rich domain-containing protein [Sphingobacterium ginsenosidimutans]|uniref:trypsin inhibitor-like cysteine-rich domain-containing protein n=1 Tax=Sphingobacterium ginsenosidimutans TaxID=687845 RepID=UPI0031F85122
MKILLLNLFLLITAVAALTLTLSASNQCGTNEEYSSCGPQMEPTVDNPEPSSSPGACKAGCFCKPGYLRDYSGNCVDSETAGETSSTPPVKPCTAGGCGSTSCSIGTDYPGGIGNSRSVTAASGYFACCWKTSWGDPGARSYPNTLCPGY